jgi:hypothetical protein
MSESSDPDKGLVCLEELNLRVLSNPDKIGEVIKDFYIEKTQAGDKQGAQIALLVRSIDQARCESGTMTNFDHTGHLKEAKPLLRLAMFLGFFLAIVLIAAGAYALHLRLTGETTIQVIGFKISTSTVGVAIAALGMLALVWPIKIVVKRTAPPTGK